MDTIEQQARDEVYYTRAIAAAAAINEATVSNCIDPPGQTPLAEWACLAEETVKEA